MQRTSRYSLYTVFIAILFFSIGVIASDSTIHVPAPTIEFSSLENEIFNLKRKELNTKTRIERLTIDMQAVEKKWQKARVDETERRVLLDTIIGADLQTTVLWDQLTAYRTHLENATQLQKWYRSHQFILGSIVSAGNDSILTIDLWKSVLDSIAPFKTNIANECRWRRERLAETRFALAALDTVRKDTTLSSHELLLIAKREFYLKNRIGSDSMLSVTGTQTDSVLNKYYQYCRESLKQITISQKTRRLYRRLISIWSYELHNFDGKPLTIGKIIIALFIIIIGLKAAQLFSKFMAHLIKQRSNLDKGIVDAGQKLFFYTFAALFILYALHSIQVPLTAFTVIGGALALGFGFGSQNVVGNFISGIILLIERPVKSGDFIEVEASIGTVETIGLRSVRIRTQGNEHLIIPNSYLLDNPLINWTLSDKIIRLELATGVVYGSPIRDVKRLLLAAASSIDRINSKPEPMVIFSDFGDNALLFHLVFWSKISSIIDKRIILSQLRFKVVDLFNQAGIIIAFPQRDVHLDASTPLRIKLESDSLPAAPGTNT